MRVVIDHLGKIWGQQTIQVNQPGSAVPEIQPNLPFDVNDFVPIGFLGEVPMAIAVSPALRVNSWPELIAYSKAVGGLNVAAPNRDGVPHLTAKLFRDRSAADVTPVYYDKCDQREGADTHRRVGRSPRRRNNSSCLESRHGALGVFS
jgi:tripartite-type tricarboxylate transporter receptor subunit TctC